MIWLPLWIYVEKPIAPFVKTSYLRWSTWLRHAISSSSCIFFSLAMWARKQKPNSFFLYTFLRVSFLSLDFWQFFNTLKFRGSSLSSPLAPTSLQSDFSPHWALHRLHSSWYQGLPELIQLVDTGRSVVCPMKSPAFLMFSFLGMPWSCWWYGYYRAKPTRKGKKEEASFLNWNELERIWWKRVILVKEGGGINDTFFLWSNNNFPNLSSLLPVFFFFKCHTIACDVIWKNANSFLLSAPKTPARQNPTLVTWTV